MYIRRPKSYNQILFFLIASCWCQELSLKVDFGEEFKKCFAKIVEKGCSFPLNFEVTTVSMRLWQRPIGYRTQQHQAVNKVFKASMQPRLQQVTILHPGRFASQIKLSKEGRKNKPTHPSPTFTVITINIIWLVVFNPLWPWQCHSPVGTHVNKTSGALNIAVWIFFYMLDAVISNIKVYVVSTSQ